MVLHLVIKVHVAQYGVHAYVLISICNQTPERVLLNVISSGIINVTLLTLFETMMCSLFGIMITFNCTNVLWSSPVPNLKSLERHVHSPVSMTAYPISFYS